MSTRLRKKYVQFLASLQKPLGGQWSFQLMCNTSLHGKEPFPGVSIALLVNLTGILVFANVCVCVCLVVVLFQVLLKGKQRDATHLWGSAVLRTHVEQVFH